MKLGSHNSFSYIKPKHWYMYPFWFMAKCQNKNILEQYSQGSRIFDIRFSFDKKGNIQIKHGFMQFNVSKKELEHYLCLLNNIANKDKIYIRFIYELNIPYRNKIRQLDGELYFKQYCVYYQSTFKNIIFFGGNRKYDWKILYDFKTTPPEMLDLYSSTTGNKLDDLWPWLYAHNHNNDNIKKYKDSNKYLLIDFI
jgi:hypothetical protein